jgi:hypothetical protein
MIALSGAAHFLAVFSVDLALFSSTVTLVSVRPEHRRQPSNAGDLSIFHHGKTSIHTSRV